MSSPLQFEPLTPTRAAEISILLGRQLTPYHLSYSGYMIRIPLADTTLPYEVDMDAAQVDLWLRRGDPLWLIASRLGISLPQPTH